MRPRELPEPTSKDVDIEVADVGGLTPRALSDERRERDEVLRVRRARVRRGATLRLEVQEEAPLREGEVHSIPIVITAPRSSPNFRYFGAVLQSVRQRARSLWRAAKDEHATPRKLACAVALGVFVGCTPAVGFHGGIAVVAATACRLSRLWALLGSRVSNFLVLPWIVLAEIQLAHRARTGQWAEIFGSNVAARAREMLLDWWLGTLPVGLALASVLGGAAYVIARRRERRGTRDGEPGARPT